MIKDQMEKIYRSLSPDEIPWNRNNPPDQLVNLVEQNKITPCRTVDFGCGTGNYALYFAGKGFNVTGIDISASAIEIAKETASRKGISCTFIAADVLGEMRDVQGTFDFAYDWELLHHIFPPERETYVRNVSRLLNPNGMYLSVCFSQQSPQFGSMEKYRQTPLGTVLYFSSEEELKELFNPYFSIIELKTIEIKGKFSPHKAVYALMRKNDR
jgi:2-polyprenyl-3-methyl-5-hydroxy-6-metoxy-1,4-benzoquinol methylase